jgi:hypothetical protein
VGQRRRPVVAAVRHTDVEEQDASALPSDRATILAVVAERNPLHRACAGVYRIVALSGEPMQR